MNRRRPRIRLSTVSAVEPSSVEAPPLLLKTPPYTTAASTRQWHRRAVAESSFGALAASLAALALWSSGELSRSRPGVVLLVVVIAVTVLVGFRAGLAAAVISTVWIWWLFTAPAKSFRIETAFDAISISVFATGTIGVLILVRRLASSRDREASLRQLAETVIDEAPIGIAVFDADLRFARVNDAMASINAIPAADHVGRRPRDLHPAADDLYGGLLSAVLTTGRPIVNQLLSNEGPELAIERHWRASYYPVRGASGRPSQSPHWSRT